ncbi:MAG: general secretion pathway protein GspK [Deltaproteobacteria bacterium]|nr:general secretion pathway protein GspK [Deltaproteobacteria bacterium]
MRAPPPFPSGDERGFALVIVMWLFTVLFVLGTEFAGSMRQDATATKNFADETQSYYLATAAANLTFYRALLDRDRGGQGQTVGEVGQTGRAGQRAGKPPMQGLNQEDEGPLVNRDGQWHQVELWGAPVMVRVTDEGGKIPINFADGAHDAKLYPLLVQVLGNMNVPSDTAAAIADAIIDWQDDDDEHRVNGAESDYYMDLPTPYPAKNKRLDSLEELLFIKGVTPELYNGGTDEYPIGLRDVFSIFNTTGQVNLRYATPEVKRVLFGLDDAELLQIETQQAQATGGSILAVLEGKLPVELQGGNLVSEDDSEGAILFVEAQAQLPSARVKAHVGAVIDIEDSSEGIVVYRWMDQMAVVETS